ncbi:hypothetical protein Syun_023084 [Stephania yunnanensis]|uniref:Glutathione peroxidase n=1 Tax=Stephania yunnanensis TaxID=152371 RepID=A0AAP0FFI8_9MAGN
MICSIRHGLSGLDFDWTSNMVITSDDVWEDYYRKYQEAKPWRLESFLYYENCCIIYGNDMATSKEARAPKDALKDVDDIHYSSSKSEIEAMPTNEVYKTPTLLRSQTATLDVNYAKGTDVDLSTYKGKALLIVNVASQCGLTNSNYTELAKLYEKYIDQGLEILAFPCNLFGGQELGTNEQIVFGPSDAVDFVQQHLKDFSGFDVSEITNLGYGPVDDEAVYYKVAGDCPKGCVYSLRLLWRKKRRYVDSDASTSQVLAQRGMGKFMILRGCYHPQGVVGGGAGDGTCPMVVFSGLDVMENQLD